jgi:hypothetical protein
MIDCHLAHPDAPDELRQRFLDDLSLPTDIHQLLPVMRDTAQNCKHITEVGVGGGHSTLAWLLVQPDELLLVDVGYQKVFSDILRLAGKTKITFWVIDSRLVELPQTDLLFIDTHHTYFQLWEELHRHGNKARRNIVLHDTTVYGEEGEDRRRPGMWLAVHEFLEANPHWEVLLRYAHCNGLTILNRRGP